MQRQALLAVISILDPGWINAEDLAAYDRSNFQH